MAGAGGVVTGGGIAGCLNNTVKQGVRTGWRAMGDAGVVENQNVVKSATMSLEFDQP
jgi:hypothetical protein